MRLSWGSRKKIHNKCSSPSLWFLSRYAFLNSIVSKKGERPFHICEYRGAVMKIIRQFGFFHCGHRSMEGMKMKMRKKNHIINFYGLYLTNKKKKIILQRNEITLTNRENEYKSWKDSTCTFTWLDNLPLSFVNYRFSFSFVQAIVRRNWNFFARSARFPASDNLLAIFTEVFNCFESSGAFPSFRRFFCLLSEL